MMEGITLLNTYTENNLVFCIVFSILGLILCGACIWLLLDAICDHHAGRIIISIILLLISIGITAFSLYEGLSNPTSAYYQVMLDDSVSYSEFTEHYEVIKQEGKIFTIQEKD